MLKKIFNKKKLNSFFSAAVVLALFQLLILQPKLFFLLVFLMLLVIIFSVWRILPKNSAIRRELQSVDGWFTKLKIASKLFLHERNYTFLISPVLLFLGTLSFVALIKNQLLVHTSVLFFIFLYFLFLEGLYSYFYSKESSFLENIFTAINFASLFFIYSSLFSFITIYNFSLWKMISLFVIFTLLSNHQLLNIYNEESEKMNYFFNIVVMVIMLEIFWSLLFLPTNFYVNSLVLISVYYFIIGISYFYFKDSLNKAIIMRHLTISLIVIILALATARWI